jgi:hypothetical protein
MIDVKNKRCVHEHCMKRPYYNLPTETRPLYCFEHKLEYMINVWKRKCDENKCKEVAIYGWRGKRKQFCFDHKVDEMINLFEENKCIECDKEYQYLFEKRKYCMKHCPDKSYTNILKRKCMFCEEYDSYFVCEECKMNKNKKEWAVVRHIKKSIDTPFKHDTNELVSECSRRRPDVMFELLKHVVIVEIDENQHKAYTCECARTNEIVNSIGGRSVIFIRYNPDKTYHNGKNKKYKMMDKLEILIKTIKEELAREHDKFCVKMIQLYYDDEEAIYKEKKEEDITDIVTI